MDKLVKIWDIGEKSAHFVTEYNDLNVGAILSLTANPDLPFIIAVGGDNNKSENFKIIDISQTKLGLYLINKVLIIKLNISIH